MSNLYLRAFVTAFVMLVPVSSFAGAATNIQLVGTVTDLTTISQQIPISSATASNGGGEFGPDQAIDGSAATRWGTNGAEGDPQWIVLDLGSPYVLSETIIDWEVASAATYEIQGSNDNSNWTTLSSETSGVMGNRTDTVAITGNYRYIRMYGLTRTTVYGYSIFEMEVYGSIPLVIDSDSDGVDDSIDQCPGTLADIAVESNGCEFGVIGGYDAPTSYPGFTRVWEDEFNGSTLNTSDWSYDIGGTGWGNNELQFYREQNTSVANGLLTIEAKEENFGGRAYTSSRIKTESLQTFQYGRVDIRAVMPQGQGLWPALWMLGQSFGTVSWPFCGEIDIMEMRGNEPNTFLGTAHWDNGGSYANYGSETTGLSPVLPSGTLADEFHVYSIVWDASTISWYFDDAATPFHVISITPSNLSEFREPFFFIFNVAVGGNFLPNPNGTASFPQKMMVDYIRVYQ